MSKKQKQVRKKHTPQRTCVVCRQKVDKQRLTRLVRTPDEGVIVDPTGKKNGRGAYLCDQVSCWDKALSTSILNQALKTNISEKETAVIATYKPVDNTETASF